MARKNSKGGGSKRAKMGRRELVGPLPWERRQPVSTAIYYVFALPAADPAKASIFQGFSPALFDHDIAMRRLPGLPADLLDLPLPTDKVLARRIAGVGGWWWLPLAVDALKQLRIPPERPFWVVFAPDPNIALAATRWARGQTVPPLVVSSSRQPGALSLDALTPGALRRHFQRVLSATPAAHPGLDVTLAKECLASRRGRRPRRLADYLPAALRTYGRAVRWTEVVSGMLRMVLMTDVLDALIGNGLVDASKREELHTFGNMVINMLDPDWMERLLSSAAAISGGDVDVVRACMKETVPLSDAIRYVQVGNPETILIDDEERIQGASPGRVVERGASYVSRNP